MWEFTGLMVGRIGRKHWRLENKERDRQNNKEYYLKNRVRILEKNKLYQSDPINKERARINGIKRRNENPIEYYKYHNERERIYRLKWKKIVVNHYTRGKNECNCCGEKIFDFLTIDHINGGGRKHKKKLNISHINLWLMRNNFPKGFQILCMNCNLSKGKNGICIHKRIKK